MRDFIMDKTDILAAFDRNKTDKGSSLHGYHQMYDSIFKNIGAPTKMLEIGVLRGESLAAWCELFPDAEIVGYDIKQRPVPEAAKRAKYIVGDSTKPGIAELVGTGYDFVIDDGDHRPEAQWDTFVNLQPCWEHAYVIEDVVGKQHTDMLMQKLQDNGFKNVVAFSSKKTDAKIQMSGVEREVGFYSIVVYKNQYL